MAQKIFSRLTINGLAFDVEVLFLAKKYRYKIKEIPVTWMDAGESKVSITKDSIRMLRDLIKIKLNDLRKKY